MSLVYLVAQAMSTKNCFSEQLKIDIEGAAA